MINRFAWYDNYTIKIISKDGIEKLLEVANNFKEVDFNRIPNFDPNLCEKCHLIYDLPTPSARDTLSRLKIKY